VSGGLLCSATEQGYGGSEAGAACETWLLKGLILLCSKSEYLPKDASIWNSEMSTRANTLGAF
jgi:hypothetical protein